MYVGGKIDVPSEYLQHLNSEGRLITPSEASKKNVPRRNGSIKGIISRYANPDLASFEKEAWGEVVMEKHAVD